MSLESAPPPYLYFMHVPKTAGTSLQAYLSRHYNPDAVCPYQVWPELLENRHKLDRYRLFMGHFFNVSELIGRDIQTISFIRSPVLRAISQFGHISRDPAHHLHEYAAQRDFDLDRFLAEKPGRNHLRNYQSRHLSAAQLPIPKEHPRRVLDQLNGWSDESLFSRAEEALTRMEIVGIVERMEQSLYLIASHFGFPPDAPPLANVGWKKPDLSELGPATIDLLAELTDVDRMIYESAVSRFEGHIASALNSYALMVARHSRWVAAQDFDTYGLWYDAEPIGRGELRWASGVDSGLVVPLAGVKRTVVLQVLERETSHLPSIMCETEGRQWVVQREGSTLSWTMEPDEERVRLVCISKSVPGDERTLGIPTLGLSVYPIDESLSSTESSKADLEILRSRPRRTSE